jgi:hypothetical protein
LSEIWRLKLHIIKVFWTIMRCTERHMNITEGVGEDVGDLGRYWDIAEKVRATMGNMKRDLDMEREIMVIWNAQTDWGATR